MWPPGRRRWAEWKFQEACLALTDGKWLHVHLVTKAAEQAPDTNLLHRPTLAF